MAAHRTEFIIFEHRYVVLGPNPANLECAHMIIKYHMCSCSSLNNRAKIPEMSASKGIQKNK